MVEFRYQNKKGFSLNTKQYYLVASGPNGVEIPALKIRVYDLDQANRVFFSIKDAIMAKLFYVDMDGYFRVKAPRLTMESSFNSSGNFYVDVLVADLYGYTEIVQVTVRLSALLNYVACPKIADAALCRFSINRTSFDPSLNATFFF